MVDFIKRGGRISADGLDTAVEGPLRALSRRIAADSLADPRPVGDTGGLASELRRRRGLVATGGAAAALASRAARRLGPLKFLARRGPTWLVAAGLPALYSSIMRGTEEMRLVASHLVLRARAAGLEPEPDRVARVTVQLLTGLPADPDVEPRHGRLVAGWLQRALRAALPLAAGVTTRNPDGLAAAATAVDPSSLTTRGPALPPG